MCITHQKLCHYNKLSCMYCNAHMIYMSTYFVLTSINLFLLHSRAATCPTSNCGRGTSLLRQELVFKCLVVIKNMFFFYNPPHCHMLSVVPFASKKKYPSAFSVKGVLSLDGNYNVFRAIVYESVNI